MTLLPDRLCAGGLLGVCLFCLRAGRAFFVAKVRHQIEIREMDTKYHLRAGTLEGKYGESKIYSLFIIP